MTVWEEIKKRYNIKEQKRFLLLIDLAHIVDSVLRLAIPTEDELKNLRDIYNGEHGNGAELLLYAKISMIVDDLLKTDFDEVYNMKISESDEYDLAQIFGLNLGVNIANYINDFNTSIILDGE